MGRSLNHNSDIVELEENKPDELTPILRVNPERGTVIRILNRVARGDSPGVPIYAELYDSDGDPLPVDTDMVMTGKQPGDARFMPLSIKEDNISTYVNKSISDQQDSNHVDSVKHELHGPAIKIRAEDEFAVEIDSDAVIDWEKSKLYFDDNGVRENRR